MITPSFGMTATERVLPSLAIDFTTAILDPRITLTRALNTATRTNSSGYVETVNADLPRFDYNPITLSCNGLLIEQSRINALSYSNDLTNAVWTKATSTVAAGVVAGPDNTLSASSWIPNNGTSPEVLRASNVTLTADKDFTISGFFKKLGNTEAVALYSSSGGNGFILNVNLTNGSIISALAVGTGTYRASGVIAYPNGWYRIWISGRHAVGNTTGQFRFRNVNASGANITGNGTDGLYVYGCQMEQSTIDISFPTSVIPTTSAALTRNADAVAMVGTNFSSWYNQSEGTFEASFICADTTSNNPHFIVVDNGTDGSTNRYAIFGLGTGFSTRVIVSSVQYNPVISGTRKQTSTDTVTFAYKASSCAAAANGGSTGTSAPPSLPSGFAKFIIGGPYTLNSTGYLNGWMQQIEYWPQRLINNEIQAFSK